MAARPLELGLQLGTKAGASAAPLIALLNYALWKGAYSSARIIAGNSYHTEVGVVMFQVLLPLRKYVFCMAVGALLPTYVGI